MSERHPKFNLLLLTGPIVLGLLASVIALGVSNEVDRENRKSAASSDERHACKEDFDCILWASGCCMWEGINKQFYAQPDSGSACAQLCEDIPNSASCVSGRCESARVVLEVKQRVQGESSPTGTHKGVTIVKKEFVREFQGKVVGVTDGDTVKVLKDGKEVKIRLWGIDAPEKKQPFGTKSKQFLSGLIFGQTITVEDKGTDRYGRTLGILKTADGKNINVEMVRAGMAWWYEYFAPNELDLKEAQEKARKRKMGLWMDRNPTAPWKWRRK